MPKFNGEFDGWVEKSDTPVYGSDGKQYPAYVFHKKINHPDGMLETYCVVSVDDAVASGDEHAFVSAQIAKYQAGLDEQAALGRWHKP